MEMTLWFLLICCVLMWIWSDIQRRQEILDLEHSLRRRDALIDWHKQLYPDAGFFDFDFDPESDDEITATRIDARA